MKSGKKKSRFLKAIPQYPCLEDLLFTMNGMKKEKMFLKSVKRNKDGEVTGCFTKKGRILYERLFELLRGVMVLADIPKETYEILINDIQETFDEIAENEL